MTRCLKAMLMLIYGTNKAKTQASTWPNSLDALPLHVMTIWKTQVWLQSILYWSHKCYWSQVEVPCVPLTTTPSKFSSPLIDKSWILQTLGHMMFTCLNMAKARLDLAVIAVPASSSTRAMDSSALCPTVVLRKAHALDPNALSGDCCEFHVKSGVGLFQHVDASLWNINGALQSTLCSLSAVNSYVLYCIRRYHKCMYYTTYSYISFIFIYSIFIYNHLL